MRQTQQVTPESIIQAAYAPKGVDWNDITARALPPRLLDESQRDRETDMTRVRGLFEELMKMSPDCPEGMTANVQQLLQSKRGEALVQALAAQRVIEVPEYVVAACAEALESHIPLCDRWPAG